MVMVTPPGIKAEGKCKVAYVATLVSQTAPDIDEINAAGSLDVSMFIKAGQFQPNKEQNRGDDRRLGSTQTFQTLGRVNPSVADLVYVANPQAAAADPNNRAMELFQAGVTGFFIVRWGLDVVTVDWAAGQKVDVWPIQFGAQRKTPLGEDDEFAVITITQAVAVTAAVTDQAQIAA
jgi:hypothetical protein